MPSPSAAGAATATSKPDVNIKASKVIRDPPETVFRTWVDRGCSVFGEVGFMTVCSFGVFMTFNHSVKYHHLFVDAPRRSSHTCVEVLKTANVSCHFSKNPFPKGK